MIDIQSVGTSTNAGGLDLAGNFLGTNVNLSGQLTAGGRLEVTGISTSTFGGGIQTANIKSSGGLEVGNLVNCSGSNALQTNASGVVDCGAITAAVSTSDLQDTYNNSSPRNSYRSLF